MQPRRFLIQVEPTLKTLLSREDPDENYQITIDDKGPKVRDATMGAAQHEKKTEEKNSKIHRG